MTMRLARILLGFVLLAMPPLARADALCPDLEQEKNTALNGVAGVQADIDRLNLCVERARLLKQLDDIAGQRADMLRKVNGVNDAAGNMGSMGNIPPLPIGALPNLPAAPVAEIKKTTPPPVEKPVSDWKVRKIWGQGAGMHAQITDSAGTLLNVVKGDPLPDGKVVETVSVRGVTISQNGKITDLSWDDASPPESSLNAPQATP